MPLQLSGVCYQAQGVTLLDRLDLVLEQGRRTLVLGPNGAGKSLLLRLCHGLIEPTSGSIRWAGGKLSTTDPAARRRQAMVFQRPVLLRRSAAANLAYARAVMGDRGRSVWDALEAFGLTALADRPARVLSGGEQQRLALARAWICAPEMLFLDEPTASLDPAATRAVEAAVARFHEEGATVVMTTHDLGQARRLADRVLFMAGGRLIEDAPADQFFTRPATAAARAFLAGDLVL
ncbi:MAG: energy-coupling factor ABC transporter ATP-binding protein [Elsteraceae bacterium]